MDRVELICQIDNLEWDGSTGPYWPPMHTINKVDIGNRMADMALAKVHGRRDMVVDGPLYRSHEVQDNKIIVTFDRVGSGLMVGSKTKLGPATPADGDMLRWFLIADKNKTWFRANAKIVGKNQVEVWSGEVDVPVAVRYAWQINPYIVNVFNKEGLPMSPFRTDTWHYEYTH
jgi:sialate O-acetylesterase